ncbi:MAG: site-specific DNA-methyltransferase [Rickettsiales bacterium]|jgi:adenine-specific DNA-methyltransferase|nr:site-specific DNA-methyltransferase [Rickettsiales bacterium]
MYFKKYGIKMVKNNRLELTWPGKEAQANPEPRILLEDREKSYGEDSENMLIHGDNLLALRSLEANFSGRVKCIYIDPPYNTGNAFEHYDDGYEHSIWLSLMRDRLEILRNLLSDDGAIIIHIDDGEQAYLKVLIDELFGRSCFVNSIAIRDSHPSGLKLSAKEKTIIKTKTYMLVYKKGPNLRINPIYQKRDLWDTHFNTFIDIDNADLLKESLRDVLLRENILSNRDKVNEYSLMNDKFKDFIFQNQNKIFQSTKEIPEAPKQESLNNVDKVIEYKTSDGERNFAYNGRRLSPLSKSIQDVGIDGSQEKYFAKLQCDFWDDVDFNNSQNEGGVAFAASKKPEFLIARLLTMFSSKGDIVLDSFLGSGTTAAVAHKMGRRWIGIELGDHAYSHCIPRLQKVVDGTDQGGISKSVGWTGGGGFKFYELASSLIVEDERGNRIISNKYNGDMLAEAMCRLMGYRYAPDRKVFWKQGYGAERNYIFTTTIIMTAQYLEEIRCALDRDSLMICCSAFIGDPGAYRNIIIKRIPQVVLDKCEWNRPGYPLPLREDFTMDDFEHGEKKSLERKEFRDKKIIGG